MNFLEFENCINLCSCDMNEIVFLFNPFWLLRKSGFTEMPWQPRESNNKSVVEMVERQHGKDRTSSVGRD